VQNALEAELLDADELRAAQMFPHEHAEHRADFGLSKPFSVK
jgi:hypothetical protein